MKKLKLNFKNTQQVLTREQLKHIVGGSGSGSDADENCCLIQQYPGSSMTSTCGISRASAEYACRTRRVDNPGYYCAVICEP